MFLFILLLPKHFIAGFLKSDLKFSDEVCLKRDFSLIYCEWRMWPYDCLQSLLRSFYPGLEHIQCLCMFHGHLR